jgi:hypothetical protein
MTEGDTAVRRLGLGGLDVVAAAGMLGGRGGGLGRKAALVRSATWPSAHTKITRREILAELDPRPKATGLAKDPVTVRWETPLEAAVVWPARSAAS